MAYEGYLIKLGGVGGETLPMRFIGIESYKCTPNQRMEAKATRSVTGVLHRTTVEHTASKIEFETPSVTNRDIDELNTLFRNHFQSVLERKIVIQYYDNETNGYKTADCYMPDVDYSIDHIDQETSTIYYKPVRYAFIEY